MNSRSNRGTCGFHVKGPVLFVFLVVIAASASILFLLDNAQAVTSPVQQIPGPKSDKKKPIHITSNRMEAYNKKNLIVFIGDVSAVQGEMEIKSDRLEVYVKKKETPSPSTAAKVGEGGTPEKSSATARESTPEGPDASSVDRLIATGNVLINQGKNKYATGDRLDYAETTGIAILTGNPRAWEENNQVIGTKIEIFLREGRTIVYGNQKRRVSVTLYPSEQKDSATSKPPIADKSSTADANGK